MAKAKKRMASRRKASKRGRAGAKLRRKKTIKRAIPKKRPAKAKMTPKKAPRKGMPVVEDTIIDVVDEPVPGVIRVTEYEAIRTTTPKPDGGPETEE